ncbi:hypothetical protein R6Q59_030215 [Mikania micrantha]
MRYGPNVFHLDLNNNPLKSLPDSRSPSNKSFEDRGEGNGSTPFYIPDTFCSTMAVEDSTNKAVIQEEEHGDPRLSPGLDAELEEGQIPCYEEQLGLEREVAATIEVAEKVGIQLAEQHSKVRAAVVGEEWHSFGVMMTD